MLPKSIYIKKLKGKGPLNFILIHNAGGCHKMFTHQIEMLLKYGTVVLLDLPGHGESPAVKENSIEESSELIYNIYKHYSLDNLFLIGLNNGANIALNTLHSFNIPANGLVLIDPPLFMKKDFVAEIETFILTLKADSYKDFIHSMVTKLLAKSEQKNIDIAFQAFMKVDKTSLQEIFQSLIAWDKKAKSILSSIDIPSLCILTDEHHCTFAKVKKIAPEFMLGKVIASKCWATLEVPTQVNAMIESFLII